MFSLVGRSTWSSDVAGNSIFAAIEAGQLDEMRAMVEANPQTLAFRDESSQSPLHLAARLTNAEFIRFLIDEGAELESRDETGRTPLFVAAFFGASSCAEELIEAGADTNAPNMIQMTPLHAATVAGNLAMVRLLVRNGADPSAEMATGQTPLDLARDTRITAIAEFLRRSLSTK